ncbi:MAG: hypothetical protein AAGA58_19795, partial [Verrucomicrobiota bacterium]
DRSKPGVSDEEGHPGSMRHKTINRNAVAPATVIESQKASIVQHGTPNDHSTSSVARSIQ